MIYLFSEVFVYFGIGILAIHFLGIYYLRSDQ